MRRRPDPCKRKVARLELRVAVQKLSLTRAMLEHGGDQTDRYACALEHGLSAQDRPAFHGDRLRGLQGPHALGDLLLRLLHVDDDQGVGLDEPLVVGIVDGLDDQASEGR